jgi:signal transduction histidine kinase
VKQIVEAHGGSVDASSDGGAHFRVVLPAHPPRPQVIGA